MTVYTHDLMIWYGTSYNQTNTYLESSASWIDLIFTNQYNIAMDSGIHSSLHENCHHQILYSKLNLKIEYPPPYIRKTWDHNRQTQLIALLKFLIGLIYSQVKMCMNK